ncbi:DUF3304 domain-containing protein [Ralstonia nicotianae]|nr:hypothetical protein CJO80_03055 [Ralstonia solanacearum]NKA33054.1 hypothetical protein [Ralstonia solanacearum]
MTMKKHSWVAIALAFCVLVCAGCKPSQSPSQAAKTAEEEDLGLKVQVLNYTDIPLGVVYVNGVWAGNMSSHAGGTSIAGAVGVPAKWRPGLTVEVEWQDDLLYAKDPNGLYKRQIPVEQYGVIHDGFLWLAFLPGDQVRAIPSNTSPGFPGFPDSLKYPFDACMAEPACAAKFYPERVPVHQQEKSHG